MVETPRAIGGVDRLLSGRQEVDDAVKRDLESLGVGD